MLFVIEIILIIFAWRAGWKFKSLIPLGVCFLLGGILGITQTNQWLINNSIYLAFIDVFGCIIPEIIMICKPPKTKIQS